MIEDPLLKRLGAIAAQRCPACLEGPMFRTLFNIHERCPRCGHRFMREAGFFQGAMYVSYALGIVTFALILLAAMHWLAPRTGMVPAMIAAFSVHLLMVPVLYRYSRVIWAHLNINTRQSGSTG